MAQDSETDWTHTQVTVDTFVHTFSSPQLGDRLELTVVLPPGYASLGRPVPTLYALDPLLTLEMVVGCSRLFGALSADRIPPTVVVGVGYPTRDFRELMACRIRDLTPSEAPFPPELPVNPPYGTGGATRLLHSLAEEIIPGIEARYAAHPADRTVIGLSLSGLFGLYALFHRPETFARYLLVSPSLWWDEAIAFAYEAAWAKEHDNLNAKVFLAVGEGEEEPGGGWKNEGFSDEAIRKVRQVSNLRRLVSRLKERAYPGLSLESSIFPDEYHLTVFPAALSRGLRQLFNMETSR